MSHRHLKSAGVCLLVMLKAQGGTWAGIPVHAPAAPEHLEITPDAEGLLKADISFTAPRTTIIGEELGTLDRIVIKRDGKTAAVLEEVEPGQHCTYTDTQLQNGYAAYSVTAFSGDNEGACAEAERVFIGVDIPLPPDRLSISDLGDRLLFSWPKTGNRGQQGERVLPNGVTYMVEELDDSYDTKKVLGETKGQTLTVFLQSDTGSPDIGRYAIRARNSAGTGDIVCRIVAKGTPYTLPYLESFAGGVSHGLCWQEGDGDISFITGESSDNDHGSLAITPSESGETVSFNLGKMFIHGAQHPRMQFRCKGLGADETLAVHMARADGAEASMLETAGPLDEWETLTIDLTAVKGEGYLVPKLQIAGGGSHPIFVDDIRLQDPYDNDISVFVKAPEYSHDTTQVDIIVTNEGLNLCENARILFHTEHKLVAAYPVPALAAGESVTIGAEAIVLPGEYGNSIEVSAVAEWAYDLNPDNDKASAQIMYETPTETQDPSGIQKMKEGPKHVDRVFTTDGIRVRGGAQHRGILIKDGRKTTAVSNL